MELTQQNIKDLYKFTRQHYVEHYDVQTELVDHLANDIESIWAENPTLSFEKSRDLSFKKFGICGFMDVVEEKQKTLNKKYRNLVTKSVKEYFKFPKIIISILIFLLIYLLIKTIPYKEEFVFGLSLVLITFPFYFIYNQHKKIKIKAEKTGKKWLFEQTTSHLGELVNFIQIPFQIGAYYFIINKNFTWNNPVILFVSIFFTFFIITLFVAIKIVPQKVTNHLKNTQPEYKIANSL